jgi:hypothetical protein
MKGYTLINSDGTVSQRDVMERKEMQEYVGGELEQVGNIISNEDSIRLNLPRNVTYPNFLGNIIIENR